MAEPPQASVRFPLAYTLLLSFPLTVLLASYVALATDHGTANVFPVVVHENGKRTLLETIFYWRHFVRELPVCVMAACIFAFCFARSAPAPRPSIRSSKLPLWTAASAVTLAAVACIVTTRQLTPAGAWRELAQFHTRDTTTRFGSHWQYHLLHLLFLPAAAIVVVRLTRFLQNTNPHRTRLPNLLIVGWLAAFVVLTSLLGPGIEPFTDPLYLGHQLREIATHTCRTLFFAAAAVAWVDLHTARRQPPSKPGTLGRELPLSLAAGCAIVAGISVQFSEKSLLDHARPGASMTSLVAAHNFEHTLDYAFVSLLTAAVYTAVRKRHPDANSHP